MKKSFKEIVAAGIVLCAAGSALAAPANVADLAAAMAEADTTEVIISGTVIVTSPILNGSAGRNAFFIQDASGADGATAIQIDDPSAVVTSTMAEGDTIANIQGTLTTFFGIREFVPTVDPSVGGPVATPAPLVLTGAVSNRDDILSELITLENVTIAETGTWAADTNYDITSGATGLVVSQIRVEDGSTLVGETIPTGAFDVTGICSQFNTTGQIFPRYDTDISGATAIENWEVYD